MDWFMGVAFTITVWVVVTLAALWLAIGAMRWARHAVVRRGLAVSPSRRQ